MPYYQLLGIVRIIVLGKLTLSENFGLGIPAANDLNSEQWVYLKKGTEFCT